MASNQPHTKRDAGGDKPSKAKGDPPKDAPAKKPQEGGSKGGRRPS